MEKKERMKWWKTERAKRVGWAALGFAVAGGAVWLIFFFPYVTTDDARVAMTMVRLAPYRVGGHVIKVNFDVGDRVKSGDVLAEIDHRIPQAAYNKAKVKADLAAKELKRAQSLVAQRTAAVQMLDKAQSQFDVADAELKEADVELDNTYLKAPFDGIVVQRAIDVGDLLSPGQTAMTVADVKDAWVAANIEETSVGAVKLGQKVSISVDEGGQMQGHVIEIHSATASQFALIPSDNGSGNFTKVVQRIPIKIAIDKTNGVPLRAGGSVEIKIKVHSL